MIKITIHITGEKKEENRHITKSIIGVVKALSKRHGFNMETEVCNK